MARTKRKEALNRQVKFSSTHIPTGVDLVVELVDECRHVSDDIECRRETNPNAACYTAS